MRMLKWTVAGLAIIAVAAFLSFFLPTRHIVRIVDTDIVRMGLERRDSGGDLVSNVRDVRMINAADVNGRPMVYRNEDTGWGWPPYFKFNSADLAARAADAVSTEADPRWMVITNYGWRVTWLSMFPNAVSMRPATAPDETLVPWFNIALLTTLAIGALLVRRWALRLFGAR